MRSTNVLGLLAGSIFVGGVIGCTVPGEAVKGDKADSTQAAQATPAAVAAAATTDFTPADLARLKWLEGNWKGTGENMDPFFERYRFENESTLAVESFDDEKLSKMSDVTRYVLKEGQFRTEREGPGYSAVEITTNSVSFVPFGGAKNSFKFQRESDDSWRATLDWPSAEGKPARQKIYQMSRIQTKK